MAGQKTPDAKTAAIRAITLKFVVAYAQAAPPREVLKAWMSEWPKVEQDGFKASAVAYRQDTLAAMGELKRALSPWEQKVLKADAVTLKAQDQADATWRIEAFAALIWALGALDAPPAFDTQISHDVLTLYPAAGLMETIGGARLRPAIEIEKARKLAELWHWRSRTRFVTERGDAFPENPDHAADGIKSFDDIVRNVAAEAGRRGDVTVIDGDFGALGKAYRDLAPAEWEIVRSIAAERHFALNWLCGYAKANQWDDTRTDT